MVQNLQRHELAQPPAMLQEMRLDQRIDLENLADRESWMQYFGVTYERLHEAVRAVGTSGDEVRRFLGRQRSPFF
jgi:hypothetical protein